MTATSKWRGHAICYNQDQGVWIYVDTGQPVEQWKNRPCGDCGLHNTPEGHDGCLGTLPGVRNACCGHGCVNEAFIQFDDGREDRGCLAVAEFRRLLKSELKPPVA
tara:strand:- start:5104 stop:5421 length:318 start_codon:yes stop_codon:yes gene_type:complete